MGPPRRAHGVHTSSVHRYGTVERSVEPPRVLSCQNSFPTETHPNPIWPDGTRRALTDHSTVPYQCTIDIQTKTGQSGDLLDDYKLRAALEGTHFFRRKLTRPEN